MRLVRRMRRRIERDAESQPRTEARVESSVNQTSVALRLMLYTPVSFRLGKAPCRRAAPALRSDASLSRVPPGLPLGRFAWPREHDCARLLHSQWSRRLSLLRRANHALSPLACMDAKICCNSVRASFVLITIRTGRSTVTVILPSLTSNLILPTLR